MIYLAVFIILFVLELIYFRFADHYNIIDKPNNRSSHTKITLRGGGIVFYFAALIFFIVHKQYPWFFLGLTLITIISFIDDIMTLSNKIRLLIHFSSVLLMAYQLELFGMSWHYLILGFIVAVGVINAYNFMDGINGITGCYSLSILSLLLLANHKYNFISSDLLYFSIAGLLVFMFFNFRQNAKCFAGDVGAVSIAFILLFSLGKLIIHKENLIFILFLSVYGIDTVWTILGRLSKKENIFKAHRSHLYQYLANEAGYNKLVIASAYGVIQFFIGLLVLWLSNQNLTFQIVYSICLLLGLSAVYLTIKYYIIKIYCK
ncbi:UDP-GlcNAc--UDP-phosphate GlcNAc-1-phosphate transferase [Sphingobacterium multivorum]|uniref:UDP-GlcNAc--UDP-phosphate GlcNAc-1-phosphate transferase n=1 Tax=Sphingobacterium multivorum TaxID=28454 RepID=UPI0028AB9E44|nr:UDP-GlcNAc--UDP-phosphate GlcNAc-1-phosphate transferase [Sphingobacterium multivorum]